MNPDKPARGSLPAFSERTNIALLVAAVALVYGNTLRNEFTLDDSVYITANPQVTDFSLTKIFHPHFVTAVFRPLTFGSYALNWRLEGAHPFGFHLINLLLHAAVTVLLYFFLKAVLTTLPSRNTVALVAAWLFALHPIHTEAVASIASGRPELLAAGFLLAACLLHMSDLEIPALLCFLLALLSKESAVAFFSLVLVCDYARGQWKSLARYARIAALTLAYVAVLWEVSGHRFGQVGNAQNILDNPLAGLSPLWRVLNALRVAWKYVGLQLFPRVLSWDYSFNEIPVYFDLRHLLPAAVAAAAVLGAWIWAARKRQYGLVVAGGIYAAGFAVTSNILVPIGTIMGDRLAYLPSAGMCLLLALGWVWMFGDSSTRSQRRQDASLALLVVVLAAFAIRTAVANKDWQDNATLYSVGLRAAPGSAKTHLFKGQFYMNEDKLDSAAAEIKIALKIYTDYLLDKRNGICYSVFASEEKSSS